MPSPEPPALPEIRERRCPYCKSERIAPAGRVTVVGGMIKVEYRCSVCGTAFVVVQKTIS